MTFHLGTYRVIHVELQYVSLSRSLCNKILALAFLLVEYCSTASCISLSYVMITLHSLLLQNFVADCNFNQIDHAFFYAFLFKRKRILSFAGDWHAFYEPSSYNETSWDCKRCWHIRRFVQCYKILGREVFRGIHTLLVWISFLYLRHVWLSSLSLSLFITSISVFCILETCCCTRVYYISLKLVIYLCLWNFQVWQNSYLLSGLSWFHCKPNIDANDKWSVLHTLHWSGIQGGHRYRNEAGNKSSNGPSRTCWFHWTRCVLVDNENPAWRLRRWQIRSVPSSCAVCWCWSPWKKTRHWCV